MHSMSFFCTCMTNVIMSYENYHEEIMTLDRWNETALLIECKCLKKEGRK